MKRSAKIGRQPGDSAVSSGGGKRGALRRRDAGQSSKLRIPGFAVAAV